MEKNNTKFFACQHVGIQIIFVDVLRMLMLTCKLFFVDFFAYSTVRYDLVTWCNENNFVLIFSGIYSYTIGERKKPMEKKST